MSLFLGNLSPNIRREELESVFRRFGRSNVQLKDGYGFVIYEDAANAERALRALRGKIICGEQISLDWSNRQPRPFQRFPRGTRFYEPYRRRNLREEDNGERIRDSRDHRGHIVGSARRPTNKPRGPHLTDAFNKEANYIRGDLDHPGEEKDLNSKEGMMDEGGAFELNPVENDRWGEPVSGSLDGNDVENEAEFERYQPYSGHDRGDDNENHQMIGTNVSPAQGSSPEKRERKHADDATPKRLDRSKPQQCFICGLMGHKMRDCPRGDAPRREKFSRFDSRKDAEMNFRGRGERGLKRGRPTSWGRPNFGRDPMLSRNYADVKGSHSRKPTRLVGGRESMDDHRLEVRQESRGKKRRQEHGKPKKQHRRSTKRSQSSSLHLESSSTSSRTHSRSSRSVSGISSHSRSRSVSSRAHSESPRSRSASVSSYSKSRSSKTRSKSWSSLQRSLSVSLDRKLPSSSKNIDTDPANDTTAKGELLHVSSPGSKQLLVANFENSELKGGLNDEMAFSSFKVDDDICMEDPRNSNEDGDFSACKIGYKENDLCMYLQGKSSFTSENPEERTAHRQALSKPDLQITIGCEPSNSMRMSTQEMCMVLKHYGLVAPEESEPGLSVGSYFGAARLWPWEMLYYRRLKKGPITTENYARRIAQNKEFGIVDKYIRSSSGWPECDKNDA